VLILMHVALIDLQRLSQLTTVNTSHYQLDNN